MPDFLKEIAGPFAAILFALAGILTWKLGELKKAAETAQSQKMPSAVAAAGNIALMVSDHAPRLIADAIVDSVKCICEELAQAEKHLAEAQVCHREDQRHLREFRSEFMETFNKMEKALTAIAKVQKGLHDG